MSSKPAPASSTTSRDDDGEPWDGAFWLMALPDQLATRDEGPSVGLTAESAWGWDPRLLAEGETLLRKEGVRGDLAYYVDPFEPSVLIIAPEDWNGDGPVATVAPCVDEGTLTRTRLRMRNARAKNEASTVAVLPEVDLGW